MVARRSSRRFDPSFDVRSNRLPTQPRHKNRMVLVAVQRGHPHGKRQDVAKSWTAIHLRPVTFIAMKTDAATLKRV